MADWIRNLLENPPEAANLNAADWAETERRMALHQAVRMRREVEAFESRWPSSPTDDAPMPAMSWGQLERQLADLADTPIKAAMARDLVSAARKMARFKPPEMVLREVLCLSWALLDETFQPEPGSEWGEGPDAMP